MIHTTITIITNADESVSVLVSFLAVAPSDVLDIFSVLFTISPPYVAYVSLDTF